MHRIFAGGVWRGLGLMLALGHIVLPSAQADRTPPAAAQPPSPPPPVPRPLENTTLAPELKAAAEAGNVPLYVFDGTRDAPIAGDTVVAWIGTSRGKERKQWLLRVRRGALTRKEKAVRAKDHTRYVSWGTRVTFKSEMEALDLWIAGPVDVTDPERRETKKVRITEARVLVPADFLRLGLDNSVRAHLYIGKRIETLTKEDPTFNPGHIYSLGKPVKPENVAYAQPTRTKLGLSPEMEYAWAGGTVALQAFYDLVNDVPELREIALNAMDKPSMFQLTRLATGTLFKSGLGPFAQPVDAAALGLLPVAMESFDTGFHFAFGDDAITSGGMLVTAATPPFDASAGILAAFAVHPKDPTRTVQLFVITAQKAPDPATTQASAAVTRP